MIMGQHMYRCARAVVRELRTIRRIERLAAFMKRQRLRHSRRQDDVATFLQQWWRQVLPTKRERDAYRQLLAASSGPALVIQCAFRCFQARVALYKRRVCVRLINEHLLGTFAVAGEEHLDVAAWFDAKATPRSHYPPMPWRSVNDALPAGLDRESMLWSTSVQPLGVDVASVSAMDAASNLGLEAGTATGAPDHVSEDASAAAAGVAQAAVSAGSQDGDGPQLSTREEDTMHEFISYLFFRGDHAGGGPSQAKRSRFTRHAAAAIATYNARAIGGGSTMHAERSSAWSHGQQALQRQNNGAMETTRPLALPNDEAFVRFVLSLRDEDGVMLPIPPAMLSALRRVQSVPTTQHDSSMEGAPLATGRTSVASSAVTGLDTYLDRIHPTTADDVGSQGPPSARSRVTSPPPVASPSSSGRGDSQRWHPFRVARMFASVWGNAKHQARCDALAAINRAVRLVAQKGQPTDDGAPMLAASDGTPTTRGTSVPDTTQQPPTPPPAEPVEVDDTPGCETPRSDAQPAHDIHAEERRRARLKAVLGEVSVSEISDVEGGGHPTGGRASPPGTPTPSSPRSERGVDPAPASASVERRRVEDALLALPHAHEQALYERWLRKQERHDHRRLRAGFVWTTRSIARVGVRQTRRVQSRNARHGQRHARAKKRKGHVQASTSDMLKTQRLAVDSLLRDLATASRIHAMGVPGMGSVASQSMDAAPGVSDTSLAGDTSGLPPLPPLPASSRATSRTRSPPFSHRFGVSPPLLEENSGELPPLGMLDTESSQMTFVDTDTAPLTSPSDPVGFQHHVNTSQLLDAADSFVLPSNDSDSAFGRSQPASPSSASRGSPNPAAVASEQREVLPRDTTVDLLPSVVEGDDEMAERLPSPPTATAPAVPPSTEPELPHGISGGTSNARRARTTPLSPLPQAQATLPPPWVHHGGATKTEASRLRRNFNRLTLSRPLSQPQRLVAAKRVRRSVSQPSLGVGANQPGSASSSLLRLPLSSEAWHSPVPKPAHPLQSVSTVSGQEEEALATSVELRWMPGIRRPQVQPLLQPLQSMSRRQLARQRALEFLQAPASDSDSDEGTEAQHAAVEPESLPAGTRAETSWASLFADDVRGQRTKDVAARKRLVPSPVQSAMPSQQPPAARPSRARHIASSGAIRTPNPADAATMRRHGRFLERQARKFGLVEQPSTSTPQAGPVDGGGSVASLTALSFLEEAGYQVGRDGSAILNKHDGRHSEDERAVVPAGKDRQRRRRGRRLKREKRRGAKRAPLPYLSPARGTVN